MIPVPEVDPVAAAFGDDAMKILPAWADIPDEFKASGWSKSDGRVTYFGKPGVDICGKWLEVVSDWFFCGLRNAKWVPKPGVDTAKALRAVKFCIGSWETSHEHKEAGCAYLLSQWFEDVTYQKGKK